MEAAQAQKEDAQAQKKPYLDFKKLKLGEYIGFVGSLILLASLFLPWFSTAFSNRASVINGEKGEQDGDRGFFNAFDTFAYLDYALLAACIAPFILAFIVLRGHSLSWRPGEVTAIVGIIATGMILLNGIVLGKPGSDIEITLEYGYPVGLLGAFLILLGGFIRQAGFAGGRRAPGSVGG